MIKHADALDAASLAFGEGRTQEAKDILEPLMVDLEDDPEALDLMGSIYSGLDNSEVAIAYYEKAIAVEPKNPQTFAYLSLEYCEKRDVASSLFYARKAYDLLNDNPLKYAELGSTVYEAMVYSHIIADQVDEARALAKEGQDKFSYSPPPSYVPELP